VSPADGEKTRGRAEDEISMNSHFRLFPKMNCRLALHHLRITCVGATRVSENFILISGNSLKRRNFPKLCFLYNARCENRSGC
jgi:hypothetical protein